MKTNIKNLPEGEYFTEFIGTDSHAHRVVRRTEKTATVARVFTKKDPEWSDKMDFKAGGFVGHVSNESEQTWLFDRFSEGFTILLRKRKGGGWTHQGQRFVEDQAVEFYKYNF